MNDCDRDKSDNMSAKRSRTRWDTERKLIEIWADILTETDRLMLTRKKKEVCATTRLNKYIAEELTKSGLVYTEKDVHNKIDSILRKGKQFYSTYRRTGKRLDDQDIKIDLEAAKTAWPNFGVFYSCFKNHPALGASTSVEDTIAISTIVEAPSPQSSSKTASTPTSASTPSSASVPSSPSTPATPSEEVTPSETRVYYTCSSEEDDDLLDTDNLVSPPVEKKTKTDKEKEKPLRQLLNRKMLLLSLNSWLAFTAIQQ